MHTDSGSSSDTKDELNFGDSSAKNKPTRKSPLRCEKYRKEGAENIMISMMKELMIKNEELMNEFKEMRSGQKGNVEKMKSIKQENKNFKKQIKSLEEQVEKLDREKRRKNLIISGVMMKTFKDDKILKVMIEGLLTKELQADIKLMGARKLGEKMGLVEMESVADKLFILRNKNKLRRLKNPIYVDSDHTQKERDMQAKIRIRAREERNMGNLVRIGYKKMYINHNEWIWDEEKTGLIIKDKRNVKSKNYK